MIVNDTIINNQLLDIPRQTLGWRFSLPVVIFAEHFQQVLSLRVC